MTNQFVIFFRVCYNEFMEKSLKTSVCSLLYILRGEKLLLARKKRGFGYGIYNGIGGKQEQGETIESTMLRETQEEIGVIPKDYEKVAVLTFDEYVGNERQNVEVHVYIAKDYEGEIAESDEMAPEWFNVGSLPYESMFLDSKFFLSQILEGKKIKAFFKYDKDFNMLEHSVEEVNNL